jgi:hypothetical protein
MMPEKGHLTPSSLEDYMMNIVHEKCKSIASIVLLVAFLSSLLNLPFCPVKTAESSGPMVWVLTETLVNPNDEQREFYGGGATPGYYEDERYKGKFTKYGVTEASFRIDDREVWRDYEYHNCTVETYFQKPPLKLTPGETVELIVGFSHSGTAEDAGVGVRFWYDSDDVDIQADWSFDNVFAYSPWAEDFDGTTEERYTFVVPPATSGGEIEISASWWNVPPCLVIWKYQAQEAKPAQPTDTPLSMDERRGWTKSEEECARMRQEVADDAQYARGGPVDALKKGRIGLIVAVTGDVVQEYCDGGERPLPRGGWITTGDCVRTGPNGRLRIQMNDRDDVRNAGPSTIHISRDSVLCFGKFDVNYDQDRTYSRETLIDLITGAIRVFFKGWGRNSSVSIKTGVTLCGMRGSDVYILHKPEDDFVGVMVLEGHVDVTSEVTGETVSLSDHQSGFIVEGDLVASGDFEQETWDAAMEESGLGDEDFPDADVEWPSDLEEPAIEEPAFKQPTLDAETPAFTPEEPAPGLEGSLPLADYMTEDEYIYIVCGVLLCGGSIIAVIAIVIFLVRRRSKRKPEDNA